MRKLKILSAPIGRNGADYYRVRQPLEYLKRAGHQVRIIDPRETQQKLDEAVRGADVLVFRIGNEQLFFTIKNNYDCAGKKLIIDMDDEVWGFNPFTTQYRHWGLKEIDYDGKKLWEDGVNDFDIERNMNTVQKAINMLEAADLITVTTDRLKEAMMEFNKNVEVLPNSIDFEKWQKFDFKRPKGKMRIGWSGGDTHFLDWASLQDILPKAQKRYDFELVLQGCRWTGTLKGVEHEYHPWVDIDAHPLKTNSLQLDMAVIPLEKSRFNTMKSCVKWYEYSSLKIPCLVSNVAPYSDEIVHNETGLLYGNAKEFDRYLKMLLTDKGLREKLGQNAYDYVKANNNMKATSLYYDRVYADGLKKKQKTIPKKLNLGCGPTKKVGYINIDMSEEFKPEVVWDLRKFPYPKELEKATLIESRNLFEHFSPDERMDVIKECYRLLKKGGVLKITVPLASPETFDAAFADPTHKSYFTPHTFDYFNRNSPFWKNHGRAYGIPPFDVSVNLVKPYYLIAILTK